MQVNDENIPINPAIRGRTREGSRARQNRNRAEAGRNNRYGREENRNNREYRARQAEQQRERQRPQITRIAPRSVILATIIIFIIFCLINAGRNKTSNSTRINTSRAEMEKSSSNEKHSYLMVKSYPWAQLYVDKKFIGNAPFRTKKKIKPGQHKITLKTVNYKPRTWKKHLKAGHLEEIKINWEKEEN